MPASEKEIPNTTTLKIALLQLTALELTAIGFSLIAREVLVQFGISFPLFSYRFLLLFYAVNFLLPVIFLKKIALTAIKLYRRYAPEHVRQRCTLTPSCSEYAILALHKYSVFVALRKIYIRLTKTCNGSYLIDYP